MISGINTEREGERGRREKGDEAAEDCRPERAWPLQQGHMTGHERRGKQASSGESSAATIWAVVSNPLR